MATILLKSDLSKEKNNLEGIEGDQQNESNLEVHIFILADAFIHY